MPNFFQGLLIMAMLFSFCFSMAIVIKLAVLWVEYRKNNENVTPKEENSGAKIYYIKETLPPKKRRKKRPRKSPNLALKGVVLHPDQFKIIEKDNDIFK